MFFCSLFRFEGTTEMFTSTSTSSTFPEHFRSTDSAVGVVLSSSVAEQHQQGQVQDPLTFLQPTTGFYQVNSEKIRFSSDIRPKFDSRQTLEMSSASPHLMKPIISSQRSIVSSTVVEPVDCPLLRQLLLQGQPNSGRNSEDANVPIRPSQINSIHCKSNLFIPKVVEQCQGNSDLTNCTSSLFQSENRICVEKDTEQGHERGEGWKIIAKKQQNQYQQHHLTLSTFQIGSFCPQNNTFSESTSLPIESSGPIDNVSSSSNLDLLYEKYKPISPKSTTKSSQLFHQLKKQYNDKRKLNSSSSSSSLEKELKKSRKNKK